MEEPDTSARNKLFSDVYLDATKTIRHYDAQRASFASLAVSGLAILFTFVSIQAKEPGNHIFVRVVSIFIILVSIISLLLTLKIDALIRRHRALDRPVGQPYSRFSLTPTLVTPNPQPHDRNRPHRSRRSYWLRIALAFRRCERPSP
jgi:uncharacterized membrane protein